jgi:hypothetical protein
MLRYFFMRLPMVLRFQGGLFIGGLGTAVVGVAALLDFEPLPADSPFEYPLPYAAIFWLIVFVGIAGAIWAWIKTPK